MAKGADPLDSPQASKEARSSSPETGNAPKEKSFRKSDPGAQKSNRKRKTGPLAAPEVTISQSQERGTAVKVWSVGTLKRKKRRGREERGVRDDEREDKEEEEKYLEIAMNMEMKRKRVAELRNCASNIAAGVHGILDIVNWGIMMSIRVMVGHHLKVFDGLGGTWFHLHQASQSLVFLIAIVGFGSGLYIENHYGAHHAPHRCIGITLMCLPYLHKLVVEIQAQRCPATAQREKVAFNGLKLKFFWSCSVKVVLSATSVPLNAISENNQFKFVIWENKNLFR
ncbi:hypothetical protein V8G54_034240 [Vigna mungo]|uniref:Uncharacterized protein n=1 Tax=Vigna mungo TaxID=3915 RepID=A0AAQ3MQ39_VIGMU